MNVNWCNVNTDACLLKPENNKTSQWTLEGGKSKGICFSWYNNDSMTSSETQSKENEGLAKPLRVNLPKPRTSSKSYTASSASSFSARNEWLVSNPWSSAPTASALRHPMLVSLAVTVSEESTRMAIPTIKVLRSRPVTLWLWRLLFVPNAGFRNPWPVEGLSEVGTRPVGAIVSAGVGITIPTFFAAQFPLSISRCWAWFSI